MILWIISGLIILGLLIAFVFYKRNKKVPTDYRTLFILGVTWLPLGIATENHAFTAMGIVFMILGLKNKSKWKEQDSIKWVDLPLNAKLVRVVLIGLAATLFIAGVVYYFYVSE